VLPSLLLLLTAVTGGALLTYVYSPSAGPNLPSPNPSLKMHPAARICAGMCTGFALLATVGFVAASFLGMSAWALGIAAAALALPWLLLLSAVYRAQIIADLSDIIARSGRGIGQAIARPSGGIGYAIFYISIAALLGMLFGHVMFQRPDGLYTGVTNNLGDLPFHLQIIASFAHGQNFPPEDPAFAGARFAYPYMADFLTAMLVRAGASVIAAMWIQNFLLGLALVGMVHYWTVELTRDRLAGAIAPLLILFSGGLGWWLLFADVSASDSGLLGVLQHLPRDYTIAGDTIWRWGNSLTTLFIPQRSILFGVPVAVFIFSQWWLALDDGEPALRVVREPEAIPKKKPAVIPKKKKERKRGAAFSFGSVSRAFAGAVPRGLGSFCVAAPSAEALGYNASPLTRLGKQTRADIFASRADFFRPFFFAKSVQPEVEAENALELKAEDITLPTSAVVRRMMAAGVFAGMLPLVHAHSYIVVMGMAACLALLFPRWRAWMAFFVPAVAIALPEIYWSTHGSGIHAQTFWGWAVGWDHGSSSVIAFWLANTGAFIPLLIVAIFWRRQERDLVSSRLLRFYLPFVLCFIAPNLVKFAPWTWDNIKMLFYWYVASVPLVALLLASWFRQAKWRWAAGGLLAVLTLAGALDIVRVLSGATGYREFDSDGIAMAEQILQRTEPRALVLHAPIYNPPVFLTGRRSLLGYPGSIWSRGLDYGLRESDIRQIYAGVPEAPELMRRYRVDYLLMSPLEDDYLKENNLSVNEAFWSQFSVIAQSGEYRLYKIELPR
jgi:hypothetical protein